MGRSGQPTKRRADPLKLVDRPASSGEDFEFGYAVKDDAKGDDFSHKVIGLTRLACSINQTYLTFSIFQTQPILLFAEALSKKSDLILFNVGHQQWQENGGRISCCPSRWKNSGFKKIF